MSEKKLYRLEEGRMIGGVCAGLAEYFSLDVNLIRIITAVAGLFTAVGLVAYLVCLLILPTKPEEEA